MNRSELQSNKTTILGMTMTDNKQQHVATSILLMITNRLDIGIKGVCWIDGYIIFYLFLCARDLLRSSQTLVIICIKTFLLGISRCSSNILIQITMASDVWLQ